MSLSRSERNSIIINDLKGIQHPLYYVIKDKNGNIQVRKRRVPLTDIKPDVKTDIKPDVKTDVKPDIKPDVKPDVKTEDNTPVYESVTNKKLLEKMLEVLERSTESKDMDKNPVERQKESEENKQFVANITEKVQKPNVTPRNGLRRRVRVLH